ncbi:TlyA family RNA methyltransferase [Paracoccaceae bacterium]|nr:TlyA family RNA methyltransferase [Paracoccaceae bacterium]
MRLDQYIVELGLAESRNMAQQLIKEGSVSLNEEMCNKPAKDIKKGARVSVAKKQQWVSRGGKKLFDAIKSFEIDVVGKTALDVGSSTGGFTQVLLQEEAEKIVAVDVGTNQLHQSLRNVPQISILEQTDIRDVSSKLIDFFDLVVVDVAFISIEKVIKDIEVTAKKGGHIIVLYKPQFEVGKKNISKNGLVKKEAEVQKMLSNFLNTLDQSSLYFVQSKNAYIKGKKGNQEIFVHLQKR